MYDLFFLKDLQQEHYYLWQLFQDVPNLKLDLTKIFLKLRYKIQVNIHPCMLGYCKMADFL